MTIFFEEKKTSCLSSTKELIKLLFFCVSFILFCAKLEYWVVNKELNKGSDQGVKNTYEKGLFEHSREKGNYWNLNYIDICNNDKLIAFEAPWKMAWPQHTDVHLSLNVFGLFICSTLSNSGACCSTWTIFNLNDGRVEKSKWQEENFKSRNHVLIKKLI